MPKENTYDKVTFALDYDGTVTSDPEGFKHFVRMMRERGHVVIVVTMRYFSECEKDPTFKEFVSHVDSYVATGRQAKKEYCLSIGVKPHIWIDDNPEAVHKSAIQIWGVSSPEGSVVVEKHSN